MLGESSRKNQETLENGETQAAQGMSRVAPRQEATTRNKAHTALDTVEWQVRRRRETVNNNKGMTYWFGKGTTGRQDLSPVRPATVESNSY